jgi:hypothetical protein
LHVSGAEVGALEQERLGFGNRQGTSGAVAEIQPRPMPLAVARERLAGDVGLTLVK